MIVLLCVMSFVWWLAQATMIMMSDSLVVT
jgi:hypothetical protein